MELKKNPKADLENKKSYFMEIGLVIALAFTWLAFEYHSSPTVKQESQNNSYGEAIEDEIIPITRPEIKVQAPPPVSAPSEMLELVSDEINLDDDFMINVETDEDTEIKIMEFDSSADSGGDVGPRDEVIDEDEVLVTVEQMPKFQGSEDPTTKFRAWVYSKLKYPEIARENNVTGTTRLSFVVDKTGTVTRVGVVKSSGDKSLDEEAKRVVSASPKWTPGMQTGKPVNIQYVFVITFNLN